MKNILIIPSWYKSEDSPSAGTFFEEEAHLVAEEYSVTMLILQRVREENSVSNDVVIENGERGIKYIKADFCFSETTDWDSSIKNFRERILYIFNKAINHIVYPDLIHGYSTFYGGLCAYWISRRTKIPYIITEHFSPFNLDFLHSQYVRVQMTKAIVEARKIACVSEFLRQQILMQNIKCNPIVVGNFINDRIFLISEGSTINNRLLSVAYYPSYIKDIDTLLKAYKYLQEWGVSFTAIIIGGGESKGGYNGVNIIEQKVYEYGLSNIVNVIGAASRIEMVKHMQECQLYVSSSIAESFGVSLCEAMLCGKKCVLTDNGGSREFITHENSFCVNIHDSFALAKAIETALLETPFSFNPYDIREHIVRKYGNKAFRMRLNNLYKDVI